MISASNYKNIPANKHLSFGRFMPIIPAMRLILGKVKSVWRALLIMASVFITVSISAQTISASIPTPRVKPAAPNSSQFLSKKDAKHFRQGMRAADQRHWDRVSRNLKKLNDPTAQRILKWRLATSSPYVSFKTLTDVSHNQSNWPRMNRVRAKSEVILFKKPLRAQETIAWFMGREPITGEGRIALARAYQKIGQTSQSDHWLRLAWRESKLTRDRQRTVYSKFKHRLTPQDHYARADHLVWLGKRYYSSARGLLSMMEPSDRALIDSRMRLGANSSGMDNALKKVPSRLRTDPGLLYERAKWRRQRKTKEYALPVYMQINSAPDSDAGKSKLWREKKIMVYWLLKEKKFTKAYHITLNHGMSRGEHFADAEFLSGWIALTKLNNPSKAFNHFQTLKTGVKLPVSLGRANYWLGRSAEALGQADAHTYYAQAAKYPNVYYGQLSAERIGQGLAYTQLPTEQTDWLAQQNFNARELVRAMHMIGEIRSERTFTQFSFHLDDVLDSQGELSQLAQLGKLYGYMKPSVRAAKQAGRLDAMLTNSGYPIPEIITSLPAKFDIPFVLAIARQESEFNTKASSHAKAYGMMQMINSTARATARKAKIPYRKSWLTNDPEYAAKLGSQHLHDLLKKYDGSYILAAVAYNAGPHRVKTWTRTYGDPRKGEIDPIDWLEIIPFSETRNYVQRVMENMEVYRARLNNDQAELKLVHHLNHGAFR